MKLFLRISTVLAFVVLGYCVPPPHEEYHHHHAEHHHVEEQKEQPMPYEFEYKVDDGEGTKHGRQEVGDETGTVKGWYGYNDANGVYRRVDYVADHHGFRAHIKTNEPGTKNEDPANVQVKAQQSPPTVHHHATHHVEKIPVYHSSAQPKIVKLEAHPHHEEPQAHHGHAYY